MNMLRLVVAVATLAGCSAGQWGCTTTEPNAPLWEQAAAPPPNPWATPGAVQVAQSPATQPPTGPPPGPAPPAVRQASHMPPDDTSAPGVSLASVEHDLPGATQDPLDDETDERSALQKTLESISPTKVVQGAQSAVGLGPDETVAREAFRQGQELYARREFAEAAEQYAKAAARWPDSALEEDAKFMLAESYFFSDQYPKANQVYSELLEKYGGSRHLDRIMQRQFSIARFWQQKYEDSSDWVPNLTDAKRPRLFTGSEAQATLNSVWMNDPRGPLADDALMASANGHFLAGRFQEAADVYAQLRSDHAQSEHQLQAHLLGLESVLQTYQGPAYDGTVLLQAEKLIETILTQFGHQLGPERERVLQTRQLVREKLAERDWEQGQHNDSLKYYGAAAQYYRWVIEQYPETEFAAKARQRLEEISGLPPRPADRFAWLTRIFGNRR